MLPVLKRFRSPDAPPTLLVVIDTEEEFDWNAPFDRNSTGVSNIGEQHRAQAAFDRFGVVPTYAIDYPVATSDDAVAVLKGWSDAGRCEIGAHLHPWVNPPHEELVSDRNSFACNLPPDLARRKLEILRDVIAERFGRPPRLYKAGRYGISGETPAMLRGLGFDIDSSVVPHLDSVAKGGPDFRGLPDEPFITADDIVELPLSVHFAGAAARLGPTLFPWLERAERFRLPGIASRLNLLERLRLSPEGHALDDMKRQTQAALARGHRYFMLTYHSSSLMPGGSPYARTAAERDAFVATLTHYLEFWHTLPSTTSTTTSRLADMMRTDALS